MQLINKSRLKEGKIRFLGGYLADFQRPGTLFQILLFIHAGILLWFLGFRHFSLDEVLPYLPGLEMVILVDTAILFLASKNLHQRQPRTLKILRYGLNLLLPLINVLCFKILTLTLPFLPLASIRDITLFSGVSLWVIFLVVECQYWRLTPSLAEARLQALQNRIHPHFLFNSLNSVLALIRHQPKQAETLLENMCELFRAVLHDHHATVLLEEELNWCQCYLDIEYLRLGDRLQVVWDRPVTLPALRVPPLLVQPLIENAIHHGISVSVTPGTLTIEVRCDENYVYLKIKNPLPDRPAARKGQRIALDNIQQRIALCFGGNAYLNTHATSHDFTAELVLPLFGGTII
ncbi:MAG: histidine kinase [Pseudomonadota bacterium]